MSTKDTFQLDHEDLMLQITNYYHRVLTQSPKILEYLDRLKISMNAIEAFKLGYCNGTLTKKIPSRKSKSGKMFREQFAGMGLLDAQKGVETFQGCLTVPVQKSDGSVQNMIAKKVRAPLREDAVAKTLQPNGVFNPILSPYDEWILCDTILDALIFWSAGMRNVSFLIHPQFLPSDVLDSFVNNGVQKIYLAFSNHEIGDEHARGLTEQFCPLGISCFRIRFPGVAHLSGLARKDESIREALNDMVYQAEPMMVETNESKEPSSLFELANHVTSQLRGSDLETETQGVDTMIKCHDRLYRARMIGNNTTPGILKVNLLIIKGRQFFQNSFDLCMDRQREKFATRVFEQFGIEKDIIQNDLGKILLHLEAEQQNSLAHHTSAQEQSYQMSDSEKMAALQFLESPSLIEDILIDLDQCGIKGESTNKLVAYLGAVSRKLLYPQPLAIIVQSSSSAGKTTLMDSILKMMPEEDVEKYSALTGQALYYMAHKNLKHKILAIAEEEGMERASYPIKLLQSEGELKIATTGKDENGHFASQEFEIRGPVSIFFSTTTLDLDEELANRALTLTVDESRDQTYAIHQQQRRAQTLEGLLAREQSETIARKHQNAQRLLQSLHVVNPYCELLSFRSDRLTMRRDHMKYLALIASITLLHQYQRPLKQSGDLQYIESTLEDIELANKLANEVLGRRLNELLPQTQKLLHLIHEMVQEKCLQVGRSQEQIRFTRKDVFHYTNWGWTQLKVHLRRLEEHDFILPHKRERGKPFVYECLYQGEGQDQTPFLMGLVPVEQLREQSSQVQAVMSGRG